MAKTTLANVGNLIDATTAATTINSNTAAIVAAFENTLSRDGTNPNTMNAPLDMNSQRILNLPTPVNPTDVVRLQDITQGAGGSGGNVPSGGSTGQVLTKNSTTNFDTSWQTVSGGAANTNLFFGGRLTLSSATPVATTDISGATTLYYAPYYNKTVPTYTSGVWTLRNFTSSSNDQVGLSLNLAGSVNWPADSVHDVFSIFNGGVVTLATRLWDNNMSPTETLLTPSIPNIITTGTTPNLWTNASNAFNGTVSQAFVNCATVSPANPGEPNYLGQDWGVGVTNVISKIVVYGPSDHAIYGSGSGAQSITLQGSNDNINWHFIMIWRGNDPNAGGAVYTIPTSITENQAYRYHRVSFDGSTGANAVRVAQIQFYKRNVPSAGRRLTHVDGILVNDAAMTARINSTTTVAVAQFEGVYLGTIHIDGGANGACSTHVGYGLSRAYGVWNYYNRVNLRLQVGSFANVKTYTPDNTQRWNVCESPINGNLFSGQIVLGFPEDTVRVDLHRDIFQDSTLAASSYEAGIGVNTAVNFSGRESSCNMDSIGQAIGFQVSPTLVVPPSVGAYTFYGLERQGNNGTGVQTISTGPRHSLMSIDWRG